MRALWIWGGAGIVYAAFSLWYNNLAGSLTSAEIDAYVQRFGAVSDEDRKNLEIARTFLENDDGGEFFMVNLIRFYDGDVSVPGSNEKLPAREVRRTYTGYFIPKLFLRAGHPAWVGPAAGRYLEAWGVEPDPGWSFVGVMRFRSRRDMMELIMDPGFEPAHAHKIAAMANTLAFPVAPGMMFFGPRVWVALVLALFAALGHLGLNTTVLSTPRVAALRQQETD